VHQGGEILLAGSINMADLEDFDMLSSDEEADIAHELASETENARFESTYLATGGGGGERSFGGGGRVLCGSEDRQNAEEVEKNAEEEKKKADVVCEALTAENVARHERLLLSEGLD
jgi:hypothetical protein